MDDVGWLACISRNGRSPAHRLASHVTYIIATSTASPGIVHSPSRLLELRLVGPSLVLGTLLQELPRSPSPCWACASLACYNFGNAEAPGLLHGTPRRARSHLGMLSVGLRLCLCYVKLWAQLRDTGLCHGFRRVKESDPRQGCQTGPVAGDPPAARGLIGLCAFRYDFSRAWIESPIPGWR